MKRNYSITLGTLVFSAAALYAQQPGPAAITPDNRFTISPGVETPIVLRAEPVAECKLHPEGVTDAEHTMRLYANADGYIRVHARAKRETAEALRLQLDCEVDGAVRTYPLHVRVASSPTPEMPSPPSVVPPPKGSRTLPALTRQEAQSATDNELMAKGYPPRPDLASGDAYARWLESVSRPLTVIPPHLVSRPGITHGSGGVQAGTASPNWSGPEARRPNDSFMGVRGDWSVPGVSGEPYTTTHSSLWVGLDGDNLSDLVQAGTEQDHTEYESWFGPVSFSFYYAWTEVLPNQPIEQATSLSVNPGDQFRVMVFTCSVNGILFWPNVNGDYGCLFLWNLTQNQFAPVFTPLNGTVFNGSEAEWIMERPSLNCPNNCTYAELSDYSAAVMYNAYALFSNGTWLPAGAVASKQLTMYNEFFNHPDNNLLSTGTIYPNYLPTDVFFDWFAFH